MVAEGQRRIGLRATSKVRDDYVISETPEGYGYWEKTGLDAKIHLKVKEEGKQSR